MNTLSQVGDLTEQLFKEIREKFQSAGNQPGILDQLRAFTAAVDWKEPWLLGLLGLEVLLLVSTVAFRKSTTYCTAVFAFAMAVVYNAEWLNGELAQHWSKFAGQPYFDKHGVFFCTLVSGPLLFLMAWLLVNYLITTAKMLVDMKRMELRYKGRQRAKQEAAHQGSTAAKKTS
ncbi:hypothetical protein WJX72_000509 [[Myrmecia] bisecta]|uniref:Transmembrane protein 18 n=1 Tax=[Myrmecia] bisecta TaxID=41462 RepID=A0AAW1Q6D4_9CHLO